MRTEMSLLFGEKKALIPNDVFERIKAARIVLFFLRQNQ